MTIPVAFEITLSSPLIVRSYRDTRVSNTLDYLPGSTLRGALAWAWRREFGEDDDFYEIFLSNENQFPFLYPGPVESAPYPLTAVTCKRHPGPTSSGGHGVIDTLLLRGKLKSPVKGITHLSDAMTCICQEARKPVSQEAHKPASRYQTSIDHQIKPPPRTYRMGVGIEEATGGAANQILFGLVALEPLIDKEKDEEEKAAPATSTPSSRRFEQPATDKQPTILSGVGQLNEEHFDKLQQLCTSEDGHPVPLFAGAACSRGFGQFTLKLERYTPPSTVKERLQKYTHREPGLFAITLLSDAILVDPYLRNTTDLQAALPDALKDAEVLLQRSKSRIASGYNALTRLPKEDEIAIQAGSVLLAKSRLPTEELIEQLEQLEQCGIGIRRNEGFGRIRVCDPFHVDVPQEARDRSHKQ